MGTREGYNALIRQFEELRTKDRGALTDGDWYLMGLWALDAPDDDSDFLTRTQPGWVDATEVACDVYFEMLPDEPEAS
jgi:hypothetical protein